MLRVLVTVLLPLAAPFILYFAWLWLMRRHAAGGALTVDWRTTPWPWLLGAGLAGALAGFAWLYVSTGHPAGTKLAPPRVVDGVVVPAHPVK